MCVPFHVRGKQTETTKRVNYVLCRIKCRETKKKALFALTFASWNSSVAMSDRVKAESASRPHGVQIAVSLSGNFGGPYYFFKATFLPALNYLCTGSLPCKSASLAIRPGRALDLGDSLCTPRATGIPPRNDLRGRRRTWEEE